MSRPLTNRSCSRCGATEGLFLAEWNRDRQAWDYVSDHDCRQSLVRRFLATWRRLWT